MNHPQSKLETPKRNRPEVVSQAEWLAARKKLLAKEKEFTRQRDALSAELHKLPMVKIEKNYTFDGPEGRKNLRDLLGNHSQLLLYHFMFDPAVDEGCKHCSHFADNLNGIVVHLGARDTAVAAISRAPLAKIQAFKKRMGWSFPWLSSYANDFNYDFHVTLDEEKGSVDYNFANSGDLFKARKIWYVKGELPGMSFFLRDGDNVFHTYSTYGRGLDAFLNTYNFLDVSPLGRQEENEPPQSWVRYHDRYSDDKLVTLSEKRP
jgi:predicted dithiol-disulfide oxidoreductase (DUF899 family)